MMPVASLQFIRELPKVELHLHLETSLRLRRLAERRRGASDPARHPPGWPALSPPSHIADPARFTGYDRLRRLRYLSRAGSIADEWYTSENIEQITYELLEEAQRQHIRYVEVRVGGRRGFALLGAPRMLDAMAHARAQAEARLGVHCGFIMTIVRERGPSIEALPLRRLLDAGVPVTVNSDDPLLLHTDLSRELHAVATAFSLDGAEVTSLVNNAARAAFAPVPAVP